MTPRSNVIRSSGFAGNTPPNWWDWFCLHTHVWHNRSACTYSSGGFTFPGRAAGLMLLCSARNKRAYSQASSCCHTSPAESKLEAENVWMHSIGSSARIFCLELLNSWYSLIWRTAWKIWRSWIMQKAEPRISNSVQQFKPKKTPCG